MTRDREGKNQNPIAEKKEKKFLPPIVVVGQMKKTGTDHADRKMF